MIQFMGWSKKPTSVAVNGVILGKDSYAYNETNQNLFLFYEFNMNDDYVVEFQ